MSGYSVPVLLFRNLRDPLWRFGDRGIHVDAPPCDLPSLRLMLACLYFPERLKIHSFCIFLVPVARMIISTCFEPISGLNKYWIIIISARLSHKIWSSSWSLGSALEHFIDVEWFIKMLKFWPFSFRSRSVEVRPRRRTFVIFGCLAVENLLLAGHQPIQDFYGQKILDWVGRKHGEVLIVDYQAALHRNSRSDQRRIVPVVPVVLLVVVVLGPCRIWIYTFKWVFLWLRSLLSLLLAGATFGADRWCLCVLRLFYTRPTCTALNSVTRTQNIARLAEWVRTISDWPEGNLFQVFFRKIKFVLFEFQVLVSFFHFCRSRWNFSIFLFFR